MLGRPPPPPTQRGSGWQSGAQHAGNVGLRSPGLRLCIRLIVCRGCGLGQESSGTVVLEQQFGAWTSRRHQFQAAQNPLSYSCKGKATCDVQESRL